MAMPSVVPQGEPLQGLSRGGHRRQALNEETQLYALRSPVTNPSAVSPVVGMLPWMNAEKLWN